MGGRSPRQALGVTEVWGPERADELSVVLADALPGEGLTADELLACCWDDPGVVLASSGGDAVLSAVVRRRDRQTTAWIKAVAVVPGARRLGRARMLLAEAETWAWAAGAAEVRWGDAAPFYLWPGIDVRFTPALCLAEASGYDEAGANVNLSCPTTHRAKPPEGVVIRRALEDEDARAVLQLVEDQWPWWLDEAQRGIEHGCCLGAFGAAAPAAAGFACHSVNRAGWVGPMATDPAGRHGGVGSALLGEVCKDLMVAGHADAEIAWIGPIGFYAKAAGASVSRVFRTYVKPRP
jgi:mycothiol synthase